MAAMSKQYQHQCGVWAAPGCAKHGSRRTPPANYCPPLAFSWSWGRFSRTSQEQNGLRISALSEDMFGPAHTLTPLPPQVTHLASTLADPQPSLPRRHSVYQVLQSPGVPAHAGPSPPSLKGHYPGTRALGGMRTVATGMCGEVPGLSICVRE